MGIFAKAIKIDHLYVVGTYDGPKFGFEPKPQFLVKLEGSDEIACMVPASTFAILVHNLDLITVKPKVMKFLDEYLSKKNPTMLAMIKKKAA